MKNNFSVVMGIKKVSMSKVSNDTGISKNTLLGLYHEKTKNPDTLTILKLCKYFYITPNQFFGIDQIDTKIQFDDEGEKKHV